LSKAVAIAVHLKDVDVVRELNERPRKTLNYDSPAEKFEEYVAAIG
jgi:IS30 family transposase